MTVSNKALVHFLIVIAVFQFSLAATAADVYVRYDESGTAHFAERPLDQSYQLLFRDLGSEIAPTPVATIPAALRSQLQHAAASHGLDYALLHAVVQTESGFDATAISRKGAVGLMQLMPATARHYGVQGSDAAELTAQLHLPAVNIDAGSRYLRDLMQQFDGDTELALAAYNAGEGAVRKAGNRVPDYPETRQYVRKVMAAVDRASMEQAAVQTAVRHRAPGGSAHHGESVQTFRGETAAIEYFEQGFPKAVAP